MVDNKNKWIEIAVGHCGNRGVAIPLSNLKSYFDLNNPLFRSFYTFDENLKDHFQVRKTIKNYPFNYYLDRIIFDIDKNNNSDEVCKSNAINLVNNGCFAICEGANMPCTTDAINHFQSNKILFAPGKASNAGGVAVSGLEMSQNSLRMYWGREEVDNKLQCIIKDIHESCVEYGQNKDYVNYVKGANIAGFIKIADAMLDQGLV